MKRILVVDDDEKIRKSLCVRLKSAGYEVDVAYDGVTATSRAIHHRPDLILLDLSMPAGNGQSVLKRLKEHPEAMAIPIFVLTASRKPGVCEEVLGIGARAFFEKPFSSAELLAAIDNEFEFD